ncbi:MAG: tRNA pseudouridine(38-40) synthase TruA, partial [Spirochaetales bacterium]|nr:tRNA pseudouridine(38-40) synthase TruA [Spirochaetales bacterium]
FSAKGRVYKYYLTDSTGYTVFNRCFCTPIRNLPGIELLNACARYLAGIHDFTTFTSAGDKSESRVREIYSAVFYREGNYTVFKIEGNAFLWKMVRSIVGSILKYAVVDDNGCGFRKALESRDRTMAGTTAPSKGLFFHKVYY